jgi:hypothetical protein
MQRSFSQDETIKGRVLEGYAPYLMISFILGGIYDYISERKLRENKEKLKN